MDELVLARSPASDGRAGGQTLTRVIGLVRVLVVLVGRPGPDPVDQDLDGPPSQARLRSRPIASWTARSSLSRCRFSTAGTSSASRVAGCPAAPSKPPRRPGRSGRSRSRSQRRLELALGLAAEAHDDVGRERRCPGRPRGSPRDARGSARRCTGGPSAGAPRRRRTGPADGATRRRWGSPRGPRPGGREVPRVRRHEPQARDGGAPSAVRRPSIARISSARSGRACRSSQPAHRLGRADVREPLLCRQVVAVAVDVLPEQGDLAKAPGR